MAKKLRRARPSPAAAPGAAPPRSRMAAVLQLWPWYLCVAAATWLSLSRLHRNHIADSLLTTLVSTMAWTPFFWRQNRYGMLWPLLCAWIHHPLLNMVAIMFCNVCLGFVAHFVLARFLCGGRLDWRPCGLMSLIVSFALGTERYLFETLSPLQFMTTPLALGLAVLCALRTGQWRWRGGACILAALVLVAWYNPAAPVMLGALLFWALVADFIGRGQWVGADSVAGLLWRERRSLACVGWICASAALAIVLMRRATYHNPTFDQGLPLRLWWQTGLALFRSMFNPSGDDKGSWLLAASLCAAYPLMTLAARWRGNHATWAHWRRGAGALAAAASYGAVVSERAWARQEGCNARYFFPVLFVALAGACVMAMGLWQTMGPTLSTRFGRGRLIATTPAAYALGTLILGVSIGVRFGPPSYRGVEAWMRDFAGESGEQLLRAECTHVTGRYWDAWPAVLYVNWQRYLRGEPRPLFAVSNYAEATMALWPKDPALWRVGILKQSVGDARFYLSRYHAPELEVYGQTPQLLLAKAKGMKP